MAKEFKLPELGENIESADITKVLVSSGDKVEVDDPVIEIETDKATVEVPSEVAGTVKEVKVSDGDTAKTGDVIFTYEEAEGGGSGDDEEKEESEEPEETEQDEAKEEEEEKTEEESSEDEEEEKEEPAKTEAAGGTYEFKLPELGENIDSADVTNVVVSEGDSVEVDDPVIEIETDKATVEVPIDKAGTVKEVKVKDGDQPKVGDVIVVIETSGGAAPAKEEKKEEPKQEKKEEKKEAPKKEEKSSDEKEKPKKEEPTPAEKEITRKDMPNNIAPAAPSVRRFAREIGIDINEVSGSGKAGRISIDDVKGFAKSQNEKIKKAGGGPIGIKAEKLPDFTKWGDIEREAMSNVRKKTAEHLSYAWATIPHVTQHDKADITELEKLRKQYGKLAEDAGGKLTVTAILLKILAYALKEFPQFNASIDMEKKEVIYKKYVNIGVAVDTDRGLLVPVIRDVDKKNIIDLSVELGEVSVKARDKKLGLEDMQGGNFSLSNLGGIGGSHFTPVVNTPEVAILGVARANWEQVYNKQKGEFEPKFMLPVSLSYDHRIIDGADGARFIRWVVNALENPFFLLLQGKG